MSRYWLLVKLDVSTSVIQIPTTTTPSIIPNRREMGGFVKVGYLFYEV